MTHSYTLLLDQNKVMVKRKSKKLPLFKGVYVCKLVILPGTPLCAATSQWHQVQYLVTYLRCTKWFGNYTAVFQESGTPLIIQFLTF